MIHIYMAICSIDLGSRINVMEDYHYRSCIPYKATISSDELSSMSLVDRIGANKIKALRFYTMKKNEGKVLFIYI